MPTPTFLSRLIERRAARRRYWQITRQAGHLTRNLYVVGNPAARWMLLQQLALFERELAVLHPIAFGPDPIPHEGGRDLAESLAASGDLLMMAACAERAVAESQWTRARDLQVGTPVWLPYSYWTPITQITPSSDLVPGLIHADLGDVATLILTPDELVRTGGADITPRDLTPFIRLGAHGGELDQWAELAVTATHAHRAQVLDVIWTYAADRVGGQAAEALASLADTERELAAAQAEGRRPRAPFTLPRAAILWAFLGIACFLVLSTLPPGAPTPARWGLGLESGGLLLDAVLVALGVRYRWAATLTSNALLIRLVRAARRLCLPLFSRTLRRTR
jgi:hypothetical protein